MPQGPYEGCPSITVVVAVLSLLCCIVWCGNRTISTLQLSALVSSLVETSPPQG